MKRSFVVLLAAAAVLALAAGPVLAGGFRIPEAGTPAMGQANAFVGQADDPSAVHHNAAGITQLDGIQVMGGMNIITTESSFTMDLTSQSGDAKDGEFHVPYFFYSNQVKDSDWWIGFGLNAPFGLGTEWDEDAPFNDYFRVNVSPLAPVDVVTETTLEIVKIAPMFAHKVNEKFSYGFGPEYYLVRSVIYKGGSHNGAGSGYSYEMDGDGEGFGFALSGLYQATDALRMGLSYHSEVTAELSGKADMLPDTSGVPYTGKASVDLNLPATLALGIHYQVSDAFSCNLDIDQTMWSAYDELAFKASGVDLPTFDKDYDDVTAIRLGGEYAIDENWTARAGYLMDSTPAPEETYDPRLPDADSTAIFLGGGYDEGTWAINGAYMALTKDDRDVDSDEPASAPVLYDGTYESNIDIIAFDFIYRF